MYNLNIFIMKALAYNVAALDKVLGLATQVGDSYKPSIASIERTALTSLLEESRKSITAVLKAEGDLATAIKLRQQAFDLLPALGVKVMLTAKSCSLSPIELAELNRIRKRFRSQPFNAKVQRASPDGPGGPSNSEGESPPAEVIARKNRQLSYDYKLITLESLIRFLEDKPAYAPNETNVDIDSLKAKLEELVAHNAAVVKARYTVTEARAYAKAIVSNRETGVIAMVSLVKIYLQSVFSKDHDFYNSTIQIKLKYR